MNKTYNYFNYQDGNIYFSKRFNYTRLIMSILWILIFIWILYDVYSINKIFNKEDIRVIGLIFLSIWDLKTFAQQIYIDLNRKVLVKSYFGLFNKEISFVSIDTFLIKNKFEYSLRPFFYEFVGQDIIIKLDTGEIFVLFERISPKHTEKIKEEILDLIRQ